MEFHLSHCRISWVETLGQYWPFWKNRARFHNRELEAWPNPIWLGRVKWVKQVVWVRPKTWSESIESPNPAGFCVDAEFLIFTQSWSERTKGSSILQRLLSNTYSIYDCSNAEFARQSPQGNISFYCQAECGWLKAAQEGYDCSARIRCWECLPYLCLNKEPWTPTEACTQ